MPLKKKKYNARFPAGRIKKIMQSDEEVGKVAQAVPIIISRTLELFVESMLTKTLRITNARNAKTLSPSHMKQCIMSESRFDFLRELVKNIPDINVAEEGDNYPERRESSEDGMLSIDSPSANGNPNGATLSWPKSNHRIQDGETNAGSSSGSSSAHSQWKYTKQHSLDSLAKSQNQYATAATTTAAAASVTLATSANDSSTPINYSIKIKMDDEPPTPAKLLRMESTPAKFETSASSPIVTPKFLPITSTKLSDTDKKPILNFDFTKIQLLRTGTSPATTPLNHSHSVTNILKFNEKTSTPIDATKIELQKVPQRSAAPSKSQSTKSSTHSSASSTLTSSNPSTTPNSVSIHSSSPSSVPLISYHIPSLSTIATSSSTLEMDEDYDDL